MACVRTRKAATHLSRCVAACDDGEPITPPLPPFPLSPPPVLLPLPLRPMPPPGPPCSCKSSVRSAATREKQSASVGCELLLLPLRPKTRVRRPGVTAHTAMRRMELVPPLTVVLPPGMLSEKKRAASMRASRASVVAEPVAGETVPTAFQCTHQKSASTHT
ncbi:MAG: hypothetical protein EOO41_05170 [Methanobacteriota archaeon]|nr:MAG: hypothetical protein EOO41_05170 [Euryarchaeota archaeon]